jgi:hypothetical protein
MQMTPLKSLARNIEPNNVFNLTEDALVGCSRLTINKYTAEYNAYQKGRAIQTRGSQLHA